MRQTRESGHRLPDLTGFPPAWERQSQNISGSSLASIALSTKRESAVRFSQRMRIKPAEKILQKDGMDDDLRNSLWSLLTSFYWDTFNKEKFGQMGYRLDYIAGSNLQELFTDLWLHYFKKPTDTIPRMFHDDTNGLGLLRGYFFSAPWYEIYDFVEFVARHGPKEKQKTFELACNSFLDREKSAYRFLNGKITEISSNEEIEEIESAISKATPYYEVREHLKSAISLLSDKENPDYRNSIKESISAVESLCRKVCNNEKVTMESALDILEGRGVLQPAWKFAFSSLFRQTCDAKGIHYALMEKPRISSADARFMLVGGSAFINYVIAETASNTLAMNVEAGQGIPPQTDEL